MELIVLSETILCGSVFVDVVVSAGHILQACRILCVGAMFCCQNGVSNLMAELCLL